MQKRNNELNDQRPRRYIMKQSKLITALILASLTTIAIAQPNNPSGGGNGQGGQGMGGQGGSTMSSGNGERPHGPPPQAIEACNNKASGAACSFVGREDKTRTGTCFAPPGGNHPLACRPEHGNSDMGGQGSGGQGGQGMGGRGPGGNY
jgi:hypothetical protein